MRRHRMRWLLLLVLVTALLPLKPEWVLAAKQYQLTLTPVDFGSIAPFGTQYMDFATLTSWTISYTGATNPKDPDPVVQVSAEPVTDFTSATSSFLPSQLGLWDGAGTTPNYIPLAYGAPIPVSYMITVLKNQETPIPVHMRLTLQGDEEPGIYSMTLRVTAVEI